MIYTYIQNLYIYKPKSNTKMSIFNYGVHLSKSEKTYSLSLIEMKKAFKVNNVNMDNSVFQCFVKGPRGYNKITYDKDFIETMKSLNLNGYAHAAYVDHPWSGSSSYEKSLANIKSELEICDSMGLKGFVLHLPKNTVEIVIETVILINSWKFKTMLLLEIPATHPEPNKSWETATSINILCDKLKENNITNVGIVPDTAHLFAGGVDVTTYEQGNKWLNDLKYPEMIKLIHLNDSKVKLGHGKDIHMIIGKGFIWNKYTLTNNEDLDTHLNKSGCKAFIDFARKYNVPVIIERHIEEEDDTKYDIKVCNHIIK